MLDVLSPYIVAGLVAWLLAQGIKVLVATIKKQGSWRNVYLSGGMPSAHSATVSAVLIIIGITEGAQSVTFGVAALLSAIVVYDSVKLRRSSGEQGEAIAALIKESKSRVQVPRISYGHTPLEALVGVALGAVVAVVINFYI